MGNETSIRVKTQLLIEDLNARGYWYPRGKELLENNNALYERLLLSPYLSQNDSVLFESLTYLQLEFGIGQDVINEMIANATVDTDDVISSLESQVEALTGDKATLVQQVDRMRLAINQEIADLNAKIAKYEEYKTKYPLLKTVWNALIEDAQNRIRVLEAVTGGGK